MNIFLCVHLWTTCVLGAQSPKRALDSHQELGLQAVWTALRGSWALNLSNLEEQNTVLAEPPLQPSVTGSMPYGHSCPGLGAVVGLLDHGSVALVAVVNCGLCLHWLWRLLVHLLTPFVCTHTVFLPDHLFWEGRTVDADYLLCDGSRTTHLQTHVQSHTPGLWLASFHFLHVFGCLEVPGFPLIMCIIYVLHNKILLP